MTPEEILASVDESMRKIRAELTASRAECERLREALKNVIADGHDLFPRNVKDGRRFRFELARAALRGDV